MRKRQLPRAPQLTSDLARSDLARWRSAAAAAAQQTLGARWRSTLEALETARSEYRALLTAKANDGGALRRAAHRVHDLEELSAVLARELRVGA